MRLPAPNFARSTLRRLVALCLVLLAVWPVPPAGEPMPTVTSSGWVGSAARARDQEAADSRFLIAYSLSTTTTTQPARLQTKESQFVAHFDPGSVQQMIVDVFGPDAPAALHVANCESHYNPDARNPSGASGVFQIMSSWAPTWLEVTGREFASSWNDAATNIRFAYWLFQRSGWRPWACAA